MVHLCLYPPPLAWKLFLAHFCDMELHVIKGSWDRNSSLFPFLFPSYICAYIPSLTSALSMPVGETNEQCGWLLLSYNLLDWGLWLRYWGLSDRLSQSQEHLVAQCQQQGAVSGLMHAWPGFCGHWATPGLRKGMKLSQGRGRMSLEPPRKGKECKLGKKQKGASKVFVKNLGAD